MRKGIHSGENAKYKIIAVDDESGILDTLGVFLEKEGYTFTGITDPIEAIERVKTEHFDLMLLDFIMTPVHGDQVVEESEKLMTGNRGKYFVLQLSFIGWAILACLTFGIGFLWLTSYITISTICFYEALAGKSDSPIEVDSEEVE